MLKLFAGIISFSAAIIVFIHGVFTGNLATYKYFAVALAILGIYLSVTCTRPTKKQRAAIQQAAARAAEQQAAAQQPKTKRLTFKVAGVTFKNDDGSDRQTIIRHLRFMDDPYVPDGFYTPEIEETEYEDEVALLCKVNGYAIGYVPKSRIDAVQDALSHYNADILEPEFTGGGYNDEGDKMPYGCKFTIEYTE